MKASTEKHRGYWVGLQASTGLMAIALFGIVGFLAAAAGAHAQNANSHAGAFLRNGAGAAARGLGGAFTAVANDASASYYNPAGLARSVWIKLLASYSQLPFDRNYNFVGAVLPFGHSSAIGVSWVGLNVAGIEARSGNSAQPDFVFTDSENAFLLSYSQRLMRGLYLGATLKLFYAKLLDQQATGTGFDVGLLVRPLKNVQVGFVLQDINAQLKWPGSYSEKLPLSGRLGVAYRLHDRFLLAMDVSQAANLPARFAVGVEFAPLSTMPIRIGFGPQGPVAGAGLMLPLESFALQIDYAFYRDELIQSPVHQVSVAIAFFRNSSSGKTSRPQIETGPPVTRSSPSSRKMQARNKTYVTVTAGRLNVRLGPGTRYAVIGKVKKGQRLEKLGRAGDWCKVRLPGGNIGWVHISYIMESIRGR